MGRGPQQAQSEGSAHRPESRHTEEGEATSHPPAGLTPKLIKEIRRDGPKAEATAPRTSYKTSCRAPGSRLWKTNSTSACAICGWTTR